MGKGGITACLAAIWLAGGALAADADAIPMTDGPYGSGRSLGSAWSMACTPRQRLVGVKLFEDGRAIVGIEALCALLANSSAGTIWASAPTTAELPDRPPPRLMAEADEAVDAEASRNILRVSSSGNRRRQGSRAVLISIPRPTEPEWTLEATDRIVLKTGHHGREVLCPDGGFVQGLRTGMEAGRRGKLVALQLLCSRGGGRESVAGAWLEVRKSRKNKDKAGVIVSRTQCGGGIANPHDGIAARALIGTADNGRVVSLGLTCARVAVPGPVSLAVDEARQWLASLAPPLPRGAVRVYAGPRWYAGAEVAVCRDGSGRGACAQASADRFCTTMNGSGRASFYVVGRISDDAIAAGGKRCPSGACRAFQQITCSG